MGCVVSASSSIFIDQHEPRNLSFFDPDLLIVVDYRSSSNSVILWWHLHIITIYHSRYLPDFVSFYYVQCVQIFENVGAFSNIVTFLDEHDIASEANRKMFSNPGVDEIDPRTL